MKLTCFPKWFLEYEDASELMARLSEVYESDLDDVKKAVFVVCAQKEDVDEGEVAKAELKGFDTSREVEDYIKTLENDWEVFFIYNQKKKVWYDFEQNVRILPKEPGDAPKEEESATEKREDLPCVQEDIPASPEPETTGGHRSGRVPNPEF